MITSDAYQENYQKAIRKIAGILEEKAAIPMVAAQMELLLLLQTDWWWQDVTLPMLENVRKRVRELSRISKKLILEEYLFRRLDQLYQITQPALEPFLLCRRAIYFSCYYFHLSAFRFAYITPTDVNRSFF